MGERIPPGFDQGIADYYERSPEENRLAEGSFQLEEARTRELIQRFAPPPPASVLDVGGAAGAYALWLAAAGYTVHLVDAVPRLVVEARRRSAAAERPLLLGPLYHLTDRGDRRRALDEATIRTRRSVAGNPAG